MKIGDLVKHTNDGELGLIINYDASICNSYKVQWLKWSTTGWYTADRLVTFKKS